MEEERKSSGKAHRLHRRLRISRLQKALEEGNRKGNNVSRVRIKTEEGEEAEGKKEGRENDGR